MKTARLAYKPVGSLLGTVAGLAVSAAFNRAWRSATHSDHVPRADEPEAGWREVLLAAALQGAVFALVKASVDRASAQWVRRMTGEWPG